VMAMFFAVIYAANWSKTYNILGYLLFRWKMSEIRNQEKKKTVILIVLLTL
jgi:hypothetical protein